MDALATTVADINKLQEAAAKLPQAQLFTEHFFIPGVYVRWLFRPADTLIVGKIHRKEHMYLVCSGEVTVVGPGYKERIVGPKMIISKPGTKRAVYAHTDAVCLTIHRTDETDLDKIEKELIEEDETAMYDARNELKSERLEVEKLLVNP